MPLWYNLIQIFIREENVWHHAKKAFLKTNIRAVYWKLGATYVALLSSRTALPCALLWYSFVSLTLAAVTVVKK